MRHLHSWKTSLSLMLLYSFGAKVKFSDKWNLNNIFTKLTIEKDSKTIEIIRHKDTYSISSRARRWQPPPTHPQRWRAGNATAVRQVWRCWQQAPQRAIRTLLRQAPLRMEPAFWGPWASLGYKHTAHSWNRGFACEKPQPPISMASEKMGWTAPAPKFRASFIQMQTAMHTQLEQEQTET